LIRRDQKRATRLGGRISILLLALAALLLGAERAWAQPVPDGCPAELGTADVIRHDFSISFCELCDVGTVRIVIENPFRGPNALDFSNIGFVMPGRRGVGGWTNAQAQSAASTSWIAGSSSNSSWRLDRARVERGCS
jgi:hypothetical protein